MTFKIALPSKDVKDARLQDLVLSSEYPNPKIDTAATPPHAGIIYLNWVTTTAIADDTIRLIYSFPHGYNYIPTVFASYSFDNGTVVLQGTLPFQYGALGMITIDADIKNINLKFYSFNFLGDPTPAFTMEVRFYVMSERGY